MIETSSELLWKSSAIFGYLACIASVSKKACKGNETASECEK